MCLQMSLNDAQFNSVKIRLRYSVSICRPAATVTTTISVVYSFPSLSK